MRSRTLNFLFAAIVLAAIALTLGSALLLRVAAGMTAMLLLSLLSALLALWTADVSTVGKTLMIEHGKQAETILHVTFMSVLPMGSLVYVLDNGRTLHVGSYPFKKYAHRLLLHASHVGVYPYGNGELFITDIFNLFVFSKRFQFSDASMTVLPSTFKTERPENRSREMGELTVRYSDDADEPSGIREWMNGDLLKRIHWKLSYKTYNPADGSISPYVKTYEEAVRPDILVLPDFNRFEMDDESAAEMRDGICEGALSISRAITEAGDTVRLLFCPNSTEELVADSPESLKTLSRSLALASFDSSFLFETLVSEAMRRAGTSSAVAFVTSRLDERSVETMLRLKRFSGMQIALLYITDQMDTEVSLKQAQLEAAGISVNVRICRGREAEP